MRRQYAALRLASGLDGFFRVDRPWDSKLIEQDPEAVRPERLLESHYNFGVRGKRAEYALRGGRVVHVEQNLKALWPFVPVGGSVGARESEVADSERRVCDFGFPPWWRLARHRRI